MLISNPVCNSWKHHNDNHVSQMLSISFLDFVGLFSFLFSTTALRPISYSVVIQPTSLLLIMYPFSVFLKLKLCPELSQPWSKLLNESFPEPQDLSTNFSIPQTTFSSSVTPMWCPLHRRNSGTLFIVLSNSFSFSLV